MKSFESWMSFNIGIEYVIFSLVTKPEIPKIEN
jgi:hypothetical protein